MAGGGGMNGMDKSGDWDFLALWRGSIIHHASCQTAQPEEGTEWAGVC